MDVFTKFGGGSVKVHAIATVAQGSPSAANNGDSYRRVHTLAHEPDGRCGGTVPSRSTSMSPGQGPAFFDSHIPSSSDPERLEHSPGARLLYWPCCGILGRVITPLKGALGLLLPLLRGCVCTKQWTRCQLIFIEVIVLYSQYDASRRRRSAQCRSLPHLGSTVNGRHYVSALI